MKKNFKKSKFVILPALATLVLTGVASVTGTVAWFTATRDVSVSGMKFEARSSSNLLIAASTATATNKENESDFKSSLTWNNRNPLDQLVPSSTIDGKNYYLNDSSIKGDGSVEESKYKKKGTSDVAYIDFTVQLKAVNVDSTSSVIYVDQLDLNYDTSWASTKGVNAFRVAFFTEKFGDSGKFTADASTNALIYTPAGATNFKTVEDGGQQKPGAVANEKALGAVNYVSAATSLATVTKSSTEYFKTIIRVWLEGEDTHCTNDLFKDYTGDWSLNLGLRLSSGNEMNGTETGDGKKPAVTNIKVADSSSSN